VMASIARTHSPDILAHK